MHEEATNRPFSTSAASGQYSLLVAAIGVFVVFVRVADRVLDR
jgi:hypothetical protein